MRYKEIIAKAPLAEIDRMPGNEYTGGKKSLRIGAGDKNIKKLPGNNAFMYSTEANHMEDGIIIKLWDSANTTPKPVQMRDEDGEEFAWRLRDWERNQSEDGPGFLIGKLVLEDVPNFPLKGALQVDTITVDEDYRGQGVAKSLYGVALSILRRPLLAGRSQTPGGRRNWLSLASIPGVDIKGYVMINEARFDNPAWAEKDIDIVMGQLGGQYIGPSKPPGIHYFAFDVVPGSGELAPAVRTELSKIYDEHGSRTGLYAIWSGAVNEQDLAEGLNELANTSLKVKEPKDFVNTNDRKQVTYKVMKFKSGKDTYLINFTVKGAPAFGKKQNWNAVNVAFGVKEKQDDYSFGDEINTDLTARNKNQFLIYSTVINAVRKFITEYNTEIDEIIMQGAGERQEVMYQRFFQSAGKYFPGWHHNGKHSLVRDVPRPTGKKVREQGVAEDELDNVVADLEQDLENPHSYDAIDHMMQTIAREHDITAKQLHDMFVAKHGQVPDEWVNELIENFADGRNPQDKGDSQRHGIPKGATMAELEKAAKASGRKGQLARWQLNMRRGRKRANESIVAEGGWASTATQNTVITPAIIVEVVAGLNEFAKEYNTWQAQSELGLEIKMGKPKGSGTYYERDLKQDPDREYGDIDIECFIHSRPDASSAQLIAQYKNAIAEFTRHNRDFASDNGTNIIMTTSAGPAQVDLIYTFNEHADWSRALSPEYRVKGVISTSLTSALAEVLNFSFSSQGVQVKTRAGRPVSFRQSKDTELTTVTTNPESWARDMFQYYYTLANGQPYADRLLDLDLHPGLKDEQRLADIVHSIRSLATELERNNLLGQGALDHVANASTLLTRVSKIYAQKLEAVINSSKFDKAATPAAEEKAKKTKLMLAKYRNEVAKLLLN